MTEPNQTKDTAILIPSYKPDGKLAPYVAALKAAGFAKIVVVDDGSGEEFAPVFATIAQDEVVHIIRYAVNGGKGVALKRGMQYLWEECPGCRFVITADSDGQHTVSDTLRMCEALHKNGNGMLLGSRNFSQENVPTRSMLGNRITSVVFYLLYGNWVSDTQTGLRGFGRDLLPKMMAVRGARYEYEMNMLIDCAIAKIPIHKLEIETVYENNNEGSHFRTLQDSARIYGTIFAGFFRFISSSAISFGLDYGLFVLFNFLFKTYVPSLEHQFRFAFIAMMGNILVATVAARLISGVFNFYVNKNLVFHDHGDTKRAIFRYMCVFLLNMLLSAGLTSSVHLWLGMSDNIAKIPVDILLFLLSYQLQQKWVFVTGDTGK